jgi:spermidine synthase
MLPDVRPRSALLLGLGGGTLALLLTRRFGCMSIVGVDDDAVVVSLGRELLGQDLPGLEVVIEDAFAFVATCRRRFDYCGVDLYRGGQIPRGVLSKAFLRQLHGLVSPGGCVTFNLFAGRRLTDQLRRLARVFRVQRQVAVGKNVVLHCRAT